MLSLKIHRSVDAALAGICEDEAHLMPKESHHRKQREERAVVLGRGRKEEGREERRDLGPGGNATRYQVRERIFSVGDDYWVERSGQRAFKVGARALRVRVTLAFDGRGHGERGSQAAVV